MDDIRHLEPESFFDPFSAQPASAVGTTPNADSAPAVGTTEPVAPEAATDVPLIIPDYSEPQHRIQLSDHLHVDIPDEMLSDARAHLWKNGFPGMTQTDTIAALLRSGVITQGVPVEGGNNFYREHGVIPNAQAADALRGYFQGADPEAPEVPAQASEAPEAGSKPSLPGAPDLATLRDQHDIDLGSAPNPGDLMQVLGQTDKSPPDPTSETISDEDGAIAMQGSRSGGAEKPATPAAGSRPTDSAQTDPAHSAVAGRGGFALPGLSDFGLRSFVASRAEHARSRQAANLENTRLDMAMEAAQDALRGVDPYLPSSGIPEDDRAIVYAERLKNDPEAHAAHYKVIGRFKRLQDTVEQWTDAAKDNPVLQKETDKKLKAVSDLMKSGEVIPDTTFKENLEKITKAIGEMFSRIFQKLGFGKSAEAGVS